MRYTFANAKSFNQPLDGWDVTSVTSATGFMETFSDSAIEDNSCLTEDIYVSWGVLQRNKVFAETYASWAPTDLPEMLLPGTCGADRRLSVEAPAAAEVAELKAKNNELEAKVNQLEAKNDKLEMKFAELEAKLTAAQ